MSEKSNRVKILPLLLGLTLILLLVGTASAAVWTDQEDYKPGSVVTIHGDNGDGAGYLAGETVNVDVQGPNGYTAICDALVDEQGAWSCPVTLWDDASAIGDYSYTAVGQSSAVSQSGEFSDSAGGYHTCFLKPDGSVDCWGANWHGQATDQAGPFTQVSVGAYHTCGLKPDGSVDCWGDDGGGQATSQAGPFTQVSVDGYHNCGLKPDGSVDCWGQRF